VLAAERHHLARLQRPERLHRLVGAPTARAGVDAADLHLVTVLATDADAQGQPARRDLRDRRQHPRHHHGVTQREQVDRHVHREAGLHREQRRRVHQAVEPDTDVERHVVADGEVVDAGLGRVGEVRGTRDVRQGEDIGRHEHADGDAGRTGTRGCGGRSGCVCGHGAS
jgi:hypothetical protein